MRDLHIRFLHEARLAAVYDASPKGKDSKKVVSTAGLMVDRVPKQEWIQIFNEVWSHAHFDGESWLVTARTRGNDPASLNAYLTRYFA